MTQEEKAHRYDEAIIKVKALYGQPLIDNTLLETIFPELKESENEKIRKAIHIYLDWLDGHKDYQPKGDYTIKDMIAWLEKQGEQKPAWSEEDEKMLECALDMIEWYSGNEDKSRLVSGWLKSLKPQNRWKPTKEQMDALAWALSLAKNCGEECAFDLRTLQDQLKKLTEE